tara:strand:- start:817 stop:1104 length:288 start_codon:yes stop_codon:yes gene_type:complete
MKAYNKKTYNDFWIQERIEEEAKIIRLNESLVLKYKSLKVIESLVKDQLNDLKQEIIENPDLIEFFDITISKINGKHIFRKAHTKTFIKLKKQYQ